MASRPRGGGGRPLRPHLRQPGRPSAREGGARVRHADALLREHPPGEGVGEERHQRHRGAPSPQTRDEREIPDPRLGHRVHSPAQALHGGQREEERGRGPAAAHQADATAREEPERLTADRCPHISSVLTRIGSRLLVLYQPATVCRGRLLALGVLSTSHL